MHVLGIPVQSNTAVAGHASYKTTFYRIYQFVYFLRPEGGVQYTEINSHTI